MFELLDVYRYELFLSLYFNKIQESDNIFLDVSKVVLLPFQGRLVVEKLSSLNPYLNFQILTSLFTLDVAREATKCQKYFEISQR